MNAIATTRKPLAAWLFQAMLLIAVCLPSGSVLGINVKMPVFALFFFAWVLFLSTHSTNWLSHSEFVMLALCFSGLCFWGLIAIFHGQSETLQVFLQWKDIASTIVLAWLCIFFVRQKLLSPEGVIMPIVCGIVALASLKLVLIMATLGLGLNPIQLLGNLFGEDSLVGGSMAFGLTRVEFSSDILGAFVLFVVLCRSLSGLRLRTISVALITVILLISALLAYARYIWFLDGVAIVAAMIIEHRVKLLLLALFTLVPLAFIYYEALQPLVEARFFSDQASDSDLIRLEQSKALLEEIKMRPMIGKGLGTHVNAVVRNSESRYSYELQWMSLLMQFGIVGLAGIAALIGASAYDLVKSKHSARPWLILLFALWLLSGWTNPHLTSSFAGATFGLFMVLFHKVRYSTAAALGGGPLTSMPNTIQPENIPVNLGAIASVTVAYNGEKFLARHLDALLCQSTPLDEIIVVNNASTDATLQLLRERYPQVTVIDLADNAGVGGGYGAGLNYALQSQKHQWVWLFDQDSVPLPDALEQLIRGMHGLDKEVPEIAIVAPYCLHQDTRRHYPGLHWRNGWRKSNSNSRVEFVDAVISSGSLVRGDCVRQVGLPRADFFIDYVDFEYCLRLRKHEYKILIVRDSVLHHSVGHPRTIRLGAFSYVWADHEPWREYYKTRNEVFTIWTYDSRLLAKGSILSRLVKHAFGILLFGNQKLSCLKMMYLGLMDGRAGILGIRSLDQAPVRISAPQEQHAGD